jgi:hypothetical protein
MSAWGRGVVGTVMVAGLVAAAAPARAQIPQSFTNLRVLPKDTPRRELISAMRTLASALSVRCEHCHVGAEAPDFKGTDFASDAKPAKRTARLMMLMVRAINDDHLARVTRAEGAAAVRVECVTCHRGLTTPRTLLAEVETALDKGGAAAAVARYRELRASSYGSGGYDFGQGTLNQLGEGLVRKGRAADALALLAVNLEFFPEAPWPHYLAGEAHRALGQADKARAAYEKAAALDPQNPMPRQRLKQMAEPPSPAP